MNHWRPRQPTKTGGIHPPREHTRRLDQASTARRRYEDRVWDKRIRDSYVQLAPGILVIYQRQPWRIVEVAERPVDLWGAEHEQRFAEDVTAWERYSHGDRPEKATWSGRPISVLVVPDGKPTSKPAHLIGPASHMWKVLPEHYSICSACGELPPCRHEENERTATDEMARTEVLMDIPAGHCLGCGEPITRRMEAIRFPGPNLWRPDLGDDSAVFHARRECSGDAHRYRTQWQEKGGTDPQTALTFDEDGTAL